MQGKNQKPCQMNEDRRSPTIQDVESLDQSYSDDSNSKQGKCEGNSTMFFTDGNGVKKGSKQLYFKCKGKFHCKQGSCKREQGLGYGFKDEPSVRRHLRERHGFHFDKEVKKGQVCFVCQTGSIQKFHSRLLKAHLLQVHNILTDGVDMKKLKKMYQKVECFYCKERIPLAEADAHLQTHDVQGKSYSLVEKKWKTFVTGRNRADYLNLNLEQTFLNQLKGNYKRVMKEQKVQTDQLSCSMKKQTYYLEKHGQFMVLAMKNIFDINAYWPSQVFYRQLLPVLRMYYKESSVIQRLKLPFQLKDLIEHQFSNLIVKGMRTKKRRVDLASRKIYSMRQEFVKPTQELYQHYFQLMVFDGFIAYNKSLEDFVDAKRSEIQSKMNQYNVRFKQQRITEVRRVRVTKKQVQGSAGRLIIRGKIKKIQKKRNVISKQLQFEKIKRSLGFWKLGDVNKGILEDRYWFKTPREVRFFNKIVFRNESWRSLIQRRCDQEKGQVEQDPTERIVYRICQRGEARAQLLGHIKPQPSRIPRFYLDPSDSQVVDSADLPERIQRKTAQYRRQIEQLRRLQESSSSSSSEKVKKLTIREERWIEVNSRHCNVIMFHKDPQYRNAVMAYPFPQLIPKYEKTKDEHQLHLSKLAKDKQYRDEFQSKMDDRFSNLCLDSQRSSIIKENEVGEIKCPNLKCTDPNTFCHDKCPKAQKMRESIGGRMGVYRQFVKSRSKTRFCM